MELRKGYKQTEVGVIPEEWGVHPLGEIVEFLDGKRRPVKDSDRAKMRGDFPYYGASGIVDYVNGYLFDEDLILLGEDGENILSRNCRLAFKVTGKVWVNNHAHVLRPKAGMDIGYLTEYLESLDYDQYNTGTAQPKINKQVCSNIFVATPPPAEQRSIAAALSDVDALLAKLDQLIAKKRDIKQAAMQQLLTGKKRLPGFSGKWEEKRLGDVLEKIVGGGTPSRSNPDYWGNEIPWVTVKDFATFHPRHTQEYVTLEGLKQSSSNLIPAGTLITSTRMALGKAVVYDVDVCINQDLKALFPKPNVSVQYLYCWFEQNAKMISELGSGSTVMGISLPDLKAVEFLLASLPEQTAIAAVLSDMDAEIAALEARRDKIRDLKQGMMQELLTGRIRLV